MTDLIINSLAFANYKAYCLSLVLFSCLGKESGKRYFKYFQPNDEYIEEKFEEIAKEKVYSIQEYDLEDCTVCSEYLHIPCDYKKEPYNYNDRMNMYKIYDKSEQIHLVIAFNYNQAITFLIDKKGVDVDYDSKGYIVNMVTL